jgi:hypothetical protein
VKEFSPARSHVRLRLGQGVILMTLAGEDGWLTREQLWAAIGGPYKMTTVNVYLLELVESGCVERAPRYQRGGYPMRITERGRIVVALWRAKRWRALAKAEDSA